MKKIFLFVIVILIMAVIVVFTIDQYRMKNNKPILFSTWGKNYAITIDKEEVNDEFRLIINKSGQENKIKISTKNIEELYNYNIYYYGLNSASIKYKNETIDLIEALEQDKITIEQIIEKAKKDTDKGIAEEHTYLDGGSKKYQYDTYCLIKCNTEDGNRDVYIGISTMKLNMKLLNQ